jgi:RNA polymerase sigma factor (sigma-70 family)
LAQEVWIVLWLKFDQLDPAAPEARQRRWLEKITETVILDLRRSQMGDPLWEASDLSDLSDSSDPSDKTALSDTFFDLLALLPPDEQQLMQLRFEGYDAQEIADRLAATSGITLSRDAVYQRISRIIRKLRNYGR